jgi:hypothetical protein
MIINFIEYFESTFYYIVNCYFQYPHELSKVKNYYYKLQTNLTIAKISFSNKL